MELEEITDIESQTIFTAPDHIFHKNNVPPVTLKVMMLIIMVLIYI